MGSCCSQIQLDGIAHEQTIICRQLFAGHVVGSRPMKRKKYLLRMIYIDNRLICTLPAHCMISKSNVKLGSVHATIRPVFSLKQCSIKQLFDSVFV